jgi:tRNA dimethylallyltransferase
MVSATSLAHNWRESLSPEARIPILTGPTAAGKTALALQLAREAGNIELINADSLLVYRQMNIGTAKPTQEELAQVPHHLIDIRDPTEEFTAGDFVRASDQAIAEILKRRNIPMFVGGTGFYLKARLYGLWDAPPTTPEVRSRLEKLPTAELWTQLQARDPESALRIGPNDRYRLVRALEIIEISGMTPTQLRAQEDPAPDSRFALWVIDRENEELESRIRARTRLMLEAGLIDETRALLESSPQSRALKAVGYAETVRYLQGAAPLGRKILPGRAGLEQEINLATRQLVKRQRTWFRGEKASQWFRLTEKNRDSDSESQIKRLFEEIIRAWTPGKAKENTHG